MALMQGFPPPADKSVKRGNFMSAPNNRWAFQHIRELQPTREIWRGEGPVSRLESASLDLGKVTGIVRHGRVISLDQLVDEAHTDAIVVLHKGRIVYERYLNGQAPQTQHQMFSATKSFVGTLMLTLIEEGKVDPAHTVASYVPELEASAFGDATVQQVLDMTTAVDYREIYDDPTSEIWRYGWVFGVWGEPAPDYSGPLTIYDYLPTLKKEGAHGLAFHYVTPNTDVLGWIIRRVTGKSVDRNIEERFWQPLGAERDGYIWLDRAGNEMAGGGLNITARDAARFGQMILQNGRYNGRQVIPESVAARILRPGDPGKFTRYYRQFPDMEWYGDVGYGYHDQWWTFNNAHRTTSAIGVHGQYIWLDPVAQMVVVKQSSSPDAEGGANESNDTDGPLLYMALARYLMGATPAR
jgi:CubicO group peptidase (beta-lactamase class C family)